VGTGRQREKRRGRARQAAPLQVQHQVVAVDDFVAGGRAEEEGDVFGAVAHDLGEFGVAVVDEALREGVAVGVGEAHQVAGLEVAGNVGDAGGQEAFALAGDALPGAVVDDHGAFGEDAVGDPALARAQAGRLGEELRPAPSVQGIGDDIRRPSAMNIWTLVLAQILAAWILVVMPPVPIPVWTPPARCSVARSIVSMTGINWASGNWVGSRSYSPATSDSNNKASASMSVATRAASVSLSPNLISSTATVSFSLTMGTA